MAYLKQAITQEHEALDSILAKVLEYLMEVNYGDIPPTIIFSFEPEAIRSIRYYLDKLEQALPNVTLYLINVHCQAIVKIIVTQDWGTALVIRVLHDTKHVAQGIFMIKDIFATNECISLVEKPRMQA